MDLKSVVGNLFGYLLLAVASLATLWCLSAIGASLIWGLSGQRAMLILTTFGFAFTTGFFGYFVRKAVAGQVLPSDPDISIAFRGGQGGL